MRIFWAILLNLAIHAEVARTDNAEISIIGFNNYIETPGEVQLGYRFKLTPGWHTYWINPGDSGGPVEFIFTEGNAFNISDISWPGPEKIPYPPLMTYGYTDEVVFPFTIVLKDLEDKEITIKTRFLVCDEICIPEQTELVLLLKNKFLNVTENSSLLSKWLGRLPLRAPPDLEIKKEQQKLVFSFNEIDEESYYFPISDNEFDFSRPQSQTNNTLNIELYPDFTGPAQGILKAGGSYYTIDVPFAENNSANELSLIMAIVFAFLGGLILNLMPCVLPVVALKAFSLVKSAEESNTSVAINALVYVLGVVLTFMGIAVTLLVLKNSGELIGWGYQLQSPTVVSSLSILIFLVGLILLGNISLGSSLSKLENNNNSQGLVGSFFTGALSVIVASPCTAPFMGAALGFALVQPDIISLSIFLSLAIGFAAPYFLLAIKPDLIKYLPKPGIWMEQLKQLFGLMMIGAALWLLWVLSLQISADSLIVVLIAWFVGGLIVWVISQTMNIAWKFGVVFLLVAGCLTIFDWDLEKKESQTDSVNTWTTEYEQELRLSDSPYFINFTAAWCITCQVNEAIAFTNAVEEKFKIKGITYLKADWTNRDESIFKELQKYQRSGVPTYVLWYPELNEPILLNEVLTESYLLRMIDEI